MYQPGTLRETKHTIFVFLYRVVDIWIGFVNVSREVAEGEGVSIFTFGRLPAART